MEANMENRMIRASPSRRLLSANRAERCKNNLQPSYQSIRSRIWTLEAHEDSVLWKRLHEGTRLRCRQSG